MPPEEVKAKADFLREVHEYEWEFFADYRDRVQQYVPGSQPFRDEYMMMLEARDRALSSAREYLEFLETIGRHAGAERDRMEARIKVAENLEDDIPYR